MTVRRGTLYLGVFLVAAGAVTLGVATGALDRSAISGALAMLWPIAVVAVGVGLVLRRSRAALVAGVLAAAVPGLALGASFAAVPEIGVPCTDGARTTTAPAEAREGAFGPTAAVSLSLSCGELTVTTQPGTAWRFDARDGASRHTDVTEDPARLSATTNRTRGGWNLDAGRADWDVVLPTGSGLDLRTELNAGRGRLDLAGARLGAVTLAVNAADLRMDLATATLDRLAVEVNAGSVALTLPADAFTGNLTANAGSLALCVPDQLALRVRSTAALGSIDVDGLVKAGNAWQTPGFDTAATKADLAIEASVGSVTINPEGGCK